MSETKKISIVIPVHNTEKFLSECLQSVADQSYPNIECIVINDCSPDNSEKIITKFVERYPAIFKYIKNQHNQGQGKCRNIGIANATGEYLYFLDSDDYIEPDCLAKMYAKLQQDLADFVIATFSFTRKDKGGWYKFCRWPNYQPMFEFSRYSLPMYVWGILYRLDFWRSNNLLFESFFAEDLLVMAKAFSLTDKITILNDPLYVYRNREDSLTHKFYSRKEMYEIISRLYLYFKETNQLNDETQAFLLCHFYNLLKMISSVVERRRYFKQFQKFIPELPTDNHYFNPPLVDSSKKSKLKKIYASKGIYLLFHPDTRKFKSFLKSIYKK